jgi:hypothetical protein
MTVRYSSLMRRTTSALFASMMLSGCALVLGIEDGDLAQPANSGGGATTGDGGNGGNGGVAGNGGGVETTPLADWTPHMDAVYLFDTDMTTDGTGHGHTLTVYAQPPSLDDQEAMQGAASLLFTQDGQGVSSDSPIYQDLGQGITFGAWVRLSDAPIDSELNIVMGVVSASLLPQGFLIWRSRLDDTLTCQVGTSLDVAHVVVKTADIEGVWVHVACRWDPSSGMFYGWADASAAMPLMFPTVEAATGDFGIPPPSGYELGGNVDEVFFVRRAMSADSIKRIYACGIDGRECLCLLDSPDEYADCGRSGSAACDQLLPCSTLAPEFE